MFPCKQSTTDFLKKKNRASWEIITKNTAQPEKPHRGTQYGAQTTGQACREIKQKKKR